jgi:hypothetical protein
LATKDRTLEFTEVQSFPAGGGGEKRVTYFKRISSRGSPAVDSLYFFLGAA